MDCNHDNENLIILLFMMVEALLPVGKFLQVLKLKNDHLKSFCGISSTA